MTGDRIRVILADDHAVVRAALRAVLGAAREIDIVGEAASGVEALAMTERLEPDVVIMDLGMSGMDGTAATREIVRRRLPTRVLVVTMQAEEDYLTHVLEDGAGGYLMKNAAGTELVNAVRAVARGDIYVHPSAARLLEERPSAANSRAAERERLDALTPRERDVLKLLSEGCSDVEIGNRLLINPKAVDTYKQRIQNKLGISERSEYIAAAIKAGVSSNA